ncbi:MAG: hypothetical protein Ct9H90mP2_04010 [Dehalococcoidia bacterium]|nr:MAG: hypothetical protein Ct9H90mP2_04010 [Dehalococcoidia bacterium]
MSVICISSSKNKVGKTTILSGIAQNKFKKRFKNFCGFIREGKKIITNEKFYNIYDPEQKKSRY